jgi:glycosyltransferase involved in cell wall biosynthesis
VNTRNAGSHVSIVVPAYNAARTVADTLASLLAQTSPSWEAVVIDDGSTDGTGECVQQFSQRDDRVRLVTQRNAGESAARNSGLARARFEWLLFLDADDWIAPRYLEKMTAALNADPALDAVHCAYARVAADGSEIEDRYRPPVGDLFPTLARRAAFPVHACVVRKALVDEVGGFDTTLRTSPDWDLWQRLARSGARFGAVREVLAYYRMSPNGASLDAQQLFKDGMRVLRQGASSDPRVPHPRPEYAGGWDEPIATQEFYLLAWCAGLLIGAGRDARGLLDLVGDDHFPELYPDAVAQCIFEAAPLPTCQPPSAWDALWPDRRQRIEEFLGALEEQSQAPGLQRKAMTSLRRMVLGASSIWSVAEEELNEERQRWQRLAEEHERTVLEYQRLVEQLNHSKTVLEEERDNWQQLAADRHGAITRLTARVEGIHGELDELRHSAENRFGDLILNRLHLRAPIGITHRLLTAFAQRMSVARLAAERLLSRRPRVISTACDVFPIYSQTFVYQELTALERQGFDLRFVYSKLDKRDYLQSPFARLWDIKRRLFLNSRLHQRDFTHYRRRMPDRVDRLLELLSESSGLSREALMAHGNVQQAFSFTRMVEAYRPAYLHSYFFYDRSLMALVAGYLLDIPRGISCYADHLLQDYELKVVPLHLELCQLVIATSERIKLELLQLAPRADPSKILVKPNGIDTERFPVMERSDPAAGAPFRLIALCRIEPKKGLLDLVDAVSVLRKRGLNLEAHIVGTADEWSQASRDYKAKLDQRIGQLDLWGKVHLEGRHNLDGILRFLRLADVFVAPFVETETGDKDGIPTALLEGMSTGLPVVATSAGSIPEVIDDGQNGILTAQHDHLALADAIQGLLLDQQRRHDLGHRGADTVRSRYDVRSCEQAFHERVRTLISEHSRSTGDMRASATAG